MLELTLFCFASLMCLCRQLPASIFFHPDVKETPFHSLVHFPVLFKFLDKFKSGSVNDILHGFPGY